MKNICIAGRVGRDAELRRTQNGDPVLGFPVAVDEGFGERKRTIWFRCSMWGKRGESVAQYIKKGSEVALSGDLSTEEYEGKINLTIRVNELTLQGGGGGKKESAPKQQSMSYGAASGGNPSRDLDDEIPFSPEWR